MLAENGTFQWSSMRRTTRNREKHDGKKCQNRSTSIDNAGGPLSSQNRHKLRPLRWYLVHVIWS